MEKISLTALARQELASARSAGSGRSAHTVYGGHEHALRQTLIALIEGHGLDEHESPGEATLHVIEGRVRLSNAEASWEGSPGDHLVIPRTRHRLDALADSAVLLTVVKPVGPHV
ncbi:cupin domain-containing protein [Mycolicibacterium fluoranthenivorans]|uniref:Quercetin dioxygenase-like cupin family protein n=1 Tax=Mycolicibacterium fluoranthenivorans TaxID=258505 RepID=A0A7X5ZGE3_9MYCO|nr:cupin domain-containing protein [Mycolicibacterium fluoranthenivorans]MCV7356423.1 cupin domain-containing protein [Mycolicibacterium fluoranthenivorans]NIH99190.1 quercetin dioxygenase-like cupin family protein [Mycolicibacterium fluoranthenivorans]